LEKVSFGRGLETVLKRFGRSWEGVRKGFRRDLKNGLEEA